MKDITKIYRDYGLNLLRTFQGVIGQLVPYMENGRMVERSFLRSSNPGNKSRPFAWVGFDYETGVFLYYKHCMSEDFMDTEQYPFHTQIENIFMTQRTAGEQAEMEQKLWELYRKVRELAFREELSESQRAVLSEYRRQWELTILVELKPYYKALAPDYFQWLSKFE